MANTPVTPEVLCHCGACTTYTAVAPPCSPWFRSGSVIDCRSNAENCQNARTFAVARRKLLTCSKLPHWHRGLGQSVVGSPRHPHDRRGTAMPAVAPYKDRSSPSITAVPPRRSAVLTVFGCATAINDGTTAEPRRSWRFHCRLCRTSTTVAPRLLCDGGSTVEAGRNMLKVSAVPPRRTAVLTAFLGATSIIDGTTAEPRQS